MEKANEERGGKAKVSQEERKRGFGGLAAALAQIRPPLPLTLFEPYLVENRVYKNTNINLDGYTFRNCAFVNCILHISKGNFELDSCFIHLCTLQISGNAATLLKLYSAFLGNWAELPQGLRPQIETDGSLTIR